VADTNQLSGVSGGYVGKRLEFFIFSTETELRIYFVNYILVAQGPTSLPRIQNRKLNLVYNPMKKTDKVGSADLQRNTAKYFR
jgi:hypothetical protein